MTSHRHSSNTGSKLDIEYLLNGPSHNSSLNLSNEPTSSGQVASSRSRQPVKSKDRPYACEICNFPFAQRSDRNKHVRTVHFGERPFVCPHCNQTFGEKGNLYAPYIPIFCILKQLLTNAINID